MITIVVRIIILTYNNNLFANNKNYNTNDNNKIKNNNYL